MSIKESSEDEETMNLSTYSKRDDNSAEKDKAAAKGSGISRPTTTRISSRTFFRDYSNSSSKNSPFRRGSFSRDGLQGEPSHNSLAMNLNSEDESDEEDVPQIGVGYDDKNFEGIETSMEVKELFQNISRYTPQEINLQYKLIPFLPNYIPAVGDVDPFIKVPRPDGVIDRIGLTVLDEPGSNQSEPAVLHLRLRSKSKSSRTSRQSVVKRVDVAEKFSKAIDKWIDDIEQLHRTKHAPSVQLTNVFPDIDALMQQWPPQVEEKLNDGQIDFSKLDCDLSSLVDIICGFLDIPVFENARLESLHVLLTLFLEVQNIKDQGF